MGFGGDSLTKAPFGVTNRREKAPIILARNTVDGSEIRRSPVEVGSFFHYLQGFIHPKGSCLGFLNHQIPKNQS